MSLTNPNHFVRCNLSTAIDLQCTVYYDELVAVMKQRNHYVCVGMSNASFVTSSHRIFFLMSDGKQSAKVIKEASKNKTAQR